MKRSFILASIAALISLVSCADRIDLNPTPEPEPVKYVPVVLSVGLDTTNIDTKTYMTDQDTIGKVSWSVGDKLFLSNAVINTGIESMPLAADSISADGKGANFTFMLTGAQAESIKTGTSYLYYGDLGKASYPGIGQGDYSPLVLNADGVPSSVRLSATQVYAGVKCFADNANMALGVMTNGQSCVMKNVFAILKIKASLESPAAGDYFDCMQLTNNATGGSQYLAGTFKISFTSDNTPQLAHEPQSGGESFTIQNIVPSSVSATTADFYFLVPPKTLLDPAGFNVLVYTRNGYYGGKKVVISNNAVLNQNKITTISLAFKKKSVPEPGLPSANSFIIAAEGKPGIYTIPADYEGNSYQGNGDNISAKSRSISGGVKAEIIWQTKLNGDVVRETEIVSNPVYVTKSDTQHFISFYCSGKEGNALVALKDKDGIIKWSWHLWVTSQADSTDIQAGKWLTTSNNRQLVQLMDRNVGALSADPTEGSQSHGLHYQFGRKDPFMGSRFTKTQLGQQDYASFASIAPETAIFCWQDDDAYAFTYSKSVLYPFVRNIISGGQWTLDANPYPTYWGTRLDSSVPATKSLDDPCPYGWMVVDENKFQALFNGGFTGQIINNGHDGGYSMYLKESDIYIPGTGYSKDRFNVNEVGGVAVFWGGNYDGDRQASQSQFVTFSITSSTTFQREKKAAEKLYTMPVRCQRWTEPANPSSVSVKSDAGSGAGVGYVSLDDFETVTIE